MVNHTTRKRKGGSSWSDPNLTADATNLTSKLTNIANDTTQQARSALDSANTSLGSAYNTVKYKTTTGATSMWNNLFSTTPTTYEPSPSASPTYQGGTHILSKSKSKPKSKSKSKSKPKSKSKSTKHKIRKGGYTINSLNYATKISPPLNVAQPTYLITSGGKNKKRHTKRHTKRR